MITLAFLFLFCICILCCFLTQKSTLSDAFFGVFGFGTVLFFGVADSPVLLDGGYSTSGDTPSFAYLSDVFRVLMKLQYVRPFFVSTPFNTLGLCPKPHSLARPQGQAVKPQPPDPVAECWVASKASRVNARAAPPLTPLQLCENS